MLTNQQGSVLQRVTHWLAILPCRVQRNVYKKLPVVDKHIVYYELRTALKTGSCAICDLVVRASERRLRFLFHECINDPGVRSELRASLGFCPRHASVIVHLGNALGIAILYHDMVNQARIRLSYTNTRAPLRAVCPECASEMEDERRYTRALASDLRDAEMQGAYAAGAGLCVGHLEEVVAQSGSEVLVFLRAQEEAKLGRLEWELGEFIRKTDYNYSHEPMEDERNSWLRALAKVAGCALCTDQGHER